MTVKTPDQIAAGLSAEQRDCIIAKSRVAGTLRQWQRMFELGFIDYNPFNPNLTPLGQSVRAILKEQDDAK